MRKISFVFISLFLAICLIGCSFFNLFQGSFDAKDWEIEKIVIKDKTYLALGALREDALTKLNDPNYDFGQNKQTDEDLGFEDRDEDEGRESRQDLEELAQSDEISTWSFDIKQNKIYGMAACNQFSANYVWKDADRINVYDPIFTRKLCSLPKTMVFELRLSQNLSGTYFVQKQGKSAMILKGDKIQIYLKKNENPQSDN